MKTGRTTRSADTMRAFAALAIVLARGAATTNTADAYTESKPSPAVEHAKLLRLNP